MARIAVDARFLGPEGTGIGRYVSNLLKNLKALDRSNEYWVILRRENQNLFTSKDNFHKIVSNAPWYSLKEQVEIPGVLHRLNPDLVHFPHFNVPVLYRGNFVITIHDLIKSSFGGDAAINPSRISHRGKQLAYELVLSSAIRRARMIFVPSRDVKNRLMEKSKLGSEKIVVTHHAASDEFFGPGPGDPEESETAQRLLSRYEIRKPFVVCVGNAYPYKNLDRLVAAMKLLPKQVSLVHPCSRSVFKARLAEKAEVLAERIVLPGFLPDEELRVLYRSAEAFVFPTLAEGFGLPAVEAMAAGTPVICSNIPVLREICGDDAIYFNPLDEQEMAGAIRSVLEDPPLKEALRMRGLARARRFSWRQSAERTLEVYLESVGPALQ